MIGGFYQPRFVWVDIDCLKTLPAREVVCGLGEVVKYGVSLDAELFAYLESNLERVLKLDEEAVMHAQGRCCELKAHIVAEDERETGLRVVLNYGHTVGHALEAAGSFRVLKHGEAVLLGMMAEGYIAREMSLLAPEALERIIDLLRRIPLKARWSPITPARVLQALKHDTKSADGKNRMVLPTHIGEVQVVDSIEPALIQASLKYISRGKQ
jgi:3-dehydroquinate synthase